MRSGFLALAVSVMCSAHGAAQSRAASGDSAALIALEHRVEQATLRGEWREYTIRYARVYIRSAGRWRLLTHHSTGESFGAL